MKKIPCTHCGGSGIEPDQKTIAATMRLKRKALRLTLAELSNKLGISPQYLHDMERGRRPWSHDRVEAIEEMGVPESRDKRRAKP